MNLRAAALIWGFGILTSAVMPLWAQELPFPKGPVLLTVSGAIGTTNKEGKAELDLDMLRQIEARTITTTTIWTEGVQTFTGVSVSALLATLNAHGSSLQASAINDYAVIIPVEDAVPEGPIIAYLQNGKTMSLRNNGPLWVIYPYDDRANYRSDIIYSRSIWQLDRIDVLD